MEILKPFQLFEPEFCRQLIQDCELSPGRVMGPDPQRQIRNNSVNWYELTQTVKDQLWNLALDLSSQYPWTWFQEPVQISRYSPGEYYDWHRDTYDLTGRASTRSLTLTCSLKPAKGALLDIEDQTFELAQGQAIFFPSNCLHRARAPLEGDRWAFTVWYMRPTRADC